MFSVEPTLQIQRDLFDLPRNRHRFERYVEVMTGGGEDLALPLTALNPMGRSSVADKLDELLRLEAERRAEAMMRQVNERLGEPGEPLRIALVVADAVGGAWTHRELTEAEHLFGRSGELARGWAVALFWTGETDSTDSIDRTVLATAYRGLHARRIGHPPTLGAALDQEGRVARFADLRWPEYPDDELARIAQVVEAHLAAAPAEPSAFTCLYGDRAAEAVGYRPLGLPDRAGFALARARVATGATDPAQLLRGTAIAGVS